jgi:hypothetical protein
MKFTQRDTLATRRPNGKLIKLELPAGKTINSDQAHTFIVFILYSQTPVMGAEIGRGVVTCLSGSGGKSFLLMTDSLNFRGADFI